MTRTHANSLFASLLGGALACAALLAPDLAAAQDFRRHRGGDAYSDTREIIALRADVREAQAAVNAKTRETNRDRATLDRANRELRLATARVRTTRARFMSAMGTRRQSSAFSAYLTANRRMMSASLERSRALSAYNRSSHELSRMQASLDRKEARLDAAVDARRAALRRTPFAPVVVSTPSSPTVVVRRPHGAPPRVVVRPAPRPYYALN